MKGGKILNNITINLQPSLKKDSVDIKKLNNNYANNVKNKGESVSSFKNLLDKTSESNYKKLDDGKENTKNIEEYSDSKEPKKLVGNKVDNTEKKEVYREEDSSNVNEDGSKEIKPKKEDLNSELMILLQQLLNGELSFEDFSLGVSQIEGGLEELSSSLTKMALEVIKQNLELDSNAQKLLQGKISNNLTLELKNLLSDNELEGSSFETIVSKLSDSINKALEEIEVYQNSGSKTSLISLQEQIINSIKSKLQNNNSDVNSNDLSNILNNNVENSKNLIAASFKGSSSENKDLSKDGSSEENFLKNLANGNKSDSASKVDKVMNFMNGFNKILNSPTVNEAIPVATVNRETFINDIIRSVKFMQQNDMKEMTVKVMPRELGEIVIKITMENGLMKANITANNKEAYNLLNSNIQDLNKIGNGEIKIQNFTIDIYNGDTTYFSRENSREGNKESQNKKN